MDAKLYGERLEDRVKFIETDMEDTYDLEGRCDDIESKHWIPRKICREETT